VSNFAARNADYFLIGRVLGATELGYYTLAYRIMALPVQFIAGAFGRVLFPVMSRAHDDVQKRALYLRTLGSVGYVAFPIGLLLAVTAHRLVPVLMGPGWEPTIVVLQILAFVSVGQAIGSTIGPVWLAVGQVREMAAYSIVASIVVVIGFLIAVQHGIAAVAGAYFVTSVAILLLPSMWLALRHLGLSLWTLPGVLWRSALSASVVAIVVFLIDLAMQDVQDIIALMVDMGVAAGLYMALSIIINKPQLLSLLSFAGFQGVLAHRVRHRFQAESDMTGKP
jgi:PST family polysaccharide transporter